MDGSRQIMTLSETARTILAERYFRRDSNRHAIEDIGTMFHRVAACVAQPSCDYGHRVEQRTERFRTRMERIEFLPNLPTLMNAGIAGGQLAACFVLPVEDDLESIFSALNLAARIHQTGGGTGFSFNKLRPRNDFVRSTGGVSSGPVSFIELFDRTTAMIRQGGRRHGANNGGAACGPSGYFGVHRGEAKSGSLGEFQSFSGYHGPISRGADIGGKVPTTKSALRPRRESC